MNTTVSLVNICHRTVTSLSSYCRECTITIFSHYSVPSATFQRNTVLNEEEKINLVLRPYTSQTCVISITKATNDAFLRNIKENLMIFNHVFVFYVEQIIFSFRPGSQTRCAFFERQTGKTIAREWALGFCSMVRRTCLLVGFMAVKNF